MESLVNPGLSSVGTIVLRHARPSISLEKWSEVRLEDPEPDRRAAGPGDGASSEELLGTKRQIKKRKRTVAGVDQDELLDPSMLADPDSYFHEFNGVHIHHKISSAEEHQDKELMGISVQGEASHSHARNDRLGLPMILLHGFGASLFSWNRVMKPLASLVESKVLAFDRPAFGLTSRVDYPPSPSSAMSAFTHLNPYSTAFSALVTLSFMDLLMGDKAILIGHSAGCLVAVDAYFKAPERVAALILVAPAIVPFLFSSNSNKEKPEDGMENGESSSNHQENIFYSIRIFLCSIYFQVKGSIIWTIKGIMNLVSYSFTMLLSAILRSFLAIFMLRLIFDRFGIAIVMKSWYDPSQATEHDISGYTKPLRAKGWEKAILEFIIALLTYTEPKKNPSCQRTLSEISCPVLIITGDHDRIVPAWNAKWLSRAVPGSQLQVINNCGHLPHEERLEEFLLICHLSKAHRRKSKTFREDDYGSCARMHDEHSK